MAYIILGVFCPPNANGGICFQAGVKGCYRLGWQPAGWTTDGTNCLALMDCFCYKAPPPGNENGMEHELKYVKNKMCEIKKQIGTNIYS